MHVQKSAVNTVPIIPMLAVLIAVFSLPLILLNFAGLATVQRLALEDGVIENLGAIAYISASLLFLVILIKTIGQSHRFLGKKTKLNIYFLGLALLFFVCAGEEISWGQRIFGWSTPDIMMEMNAQQETNLHNLWTFHARNADGSKKTWAERMLNANRFLSIFWLLYCVALPILTSLSVQCKSLAHRMGVPVPPLWVGIPFLTALLTLHSLGSFADTFDAKEKVSELNELKETLYAFAFLLLAIHFYRSGTQETIS